MAYALGYIPSPLRGPIRTRLRRDIEFEKSAGSIAIWTSMKAERLFHCDFFAKSKEVAVEESICLP